MVLLKRAHNNQRIEPKTPSCWNMRMRSVTVATILLIRAVRERSANTTAGPTTTPVATSPSASMVTTAVSERCGRRVAGDQGSRRGGVGEHRCTIIYAMMFNQLLFLDLKHGSSIRKRGERYGVSNLTHNVTKLWD